MVLEIAQLVGTEIEVVQPSEQSAEAPRIPADTALVLVAAEEHFEDAWVDCPVVTVGHWGKAADIRLPEQANLLVQVFAELSLQAGREDAEIASLLHPVMKTSRQRKTLFVAGWQGGIGSSTAATELARVGGAILLDASNHPPAGVPAEDELHWGLIDPADPPLPADLLRGLTRVAGVRRLGGGPGEGVEVSDARVLTAINAAPMTTVVDAGVWQPKVESVLVALLARGFQTSLVMVGADTRDGGLRLAGILSAASGVGIPQLVLARGKDTRVLASVADHWKVDFCQFPTGRPARQGRGWSLLWEQIWKT